MVLVWELLLCSVKKAFSIAKTVFDFRLTLKICIILYLDK